ncbi:MAG: hypothetical protein ACHBN1_33035 [Heteroscytonema crispum UTEX LB 1556]
MNRLGDFAWSTPFKSRLQICDRQFPKNSYLFTSLDFGKIEEKRSPKLHSCQIVNYSQYILESDRPKSPPLPLSPSPPPPTLQLLTFMLLVTTACLGRLKYIQMDYLVRRETQNPVFYKQGGSPRRLLNSRKNGIIVSVQDIKTYRGTLGKYTPNTRLDEIKGNITQPNWANWVSLGTW